MKSALFVIQAHASGFTPFALFLPVANKATYDPGNQITASEF
nr:hypothetical protein [Enterococcus faecium]